MTVHRVENMHHHVQGPRWRAAGVFLCPSLFKPLPLSFCPVKGKMTVGSGELSVQTLNPKDKPDAR